MIYTLENDSLKVQVNSHGGELWSIQTKDGAEYLWQGDETYWKDRALNLFPYIARLTEGKYTLDLSLIHILRSMYTRSGHFYRRLLQRAWQRLPEATDCTGSSPLCWGFRQTV